MNGVNSTRTDDSSGSCNGIFCAVEAAENRSSHGEHEDVIDEGEADEQANHAQGNLHNTNVTCII